MNEGLTILVAEDDVNIRNGLVDTLESEGYRVQAVADGTRALEQTHKARFDLVILDVMMPGLNGYDVCREIRRRDAQVPIIMLTAKGEEIDKVVGLQLGADDYVTKPFGVHELLARIAAVLRRSRRGAAPDASRGGGEAETFAFGGGVVNRKTFMISRGGKRYSLTRRELELLEIFQSRAGQVISREALMQEAWGQDYRGTTRTLDQHIAQLRKKVEPDPENPRTILTVHGVGYRLADTALAE